MTDRLDEVQELLARYDAKFKEGDIYLRFWSDGSCSLVDDENPLFFESFGSVEQLIESTRKVCDKAGI